MKRLSFCLLISLLSLGTLMGCGGSSSNSSSPTAAEIVAADKASLTVGYASGDTSSSVTQNLTLPASGSQGSTITWSSSNAAVVSNAGVISRPLTGDAAATLTATITMTGASDTKLFPVTVKAQMIDAEAVADAKAALAITFAAGDDATSVTQNLTLTTSGLHNTTVSWSSDNGAIANDGTVSRPDTGDATATLTATITLNAASDTKAFPLTVKALMTDDQAVADAKSKLTISYADGDADTTVTQNLTLPTTGAHGTTVSWSSTNVAIGSDGTVSRPVTGDLPVTLTATVSLRASTITRDFIVTVKAQMTDAEAVAAAKQALQIGYNGGDSAASVIQNLDLPVTGSSGCIINWTSSDPAVALDGTVTRPDIGDVQVTLTAHISSHGVTDTADFVVTVKGQVSDDDAIAAAKAALNIGYGFGDSAASVTQNVFLPTILGDCSITWDSDSPGNVAVDGTVQAPFDADLVVTLTATIHSHAVSDTKQFVLTVKGVMSDTGAVATDKAAVDIHYGPGDSITSVQHNIVLPTAGVNGTDITWATSDASVITSSGGVTLPDELDASVTMTATIHKGAASDDRPFALTVPAKKLSGWINRSAVSPGDGAIEVDPGVVIRIPFWVALDASTVNDSTFQLFETDTLNPVAVTVVYDAPSQTVSLTPQSPLKENVQYTAAVVGTLNDLAEDSLAISKTFNFTTLSYADILSQWKFNGDGNDSSGHDNIFTAYNLFNPADLYLNDAVHEGSDSLYLDGNWQYGLSDINLGSQLTVAAWVNVDNPIKPSLNTIMSNTAPGEESNGFKLCINRWNGASESDQSVVIEVGDGATGGKWATAPGLIQPGNWYHLAFVIDQPGHSLKVYFNGVEAPLAFESDQGYTVDQFNYSFNTAGPFTIGAFSGGMSYNFKGHLDDMRVYNHVLSAEEIAKIAQER